MEINNCGGGMMLHLYRMVPNELSWYTIFCDGSDGCCITLTAGEYTYGESSSLLDDATVWLVIVYHPEQKTRWHGGHVIIIELAKLLRLLIPSKQEQLNEFLCWVIIKIPINVFIRFMVKTHCNFKNKKNEN